MAVIDGEIDKTMRMKCEANDATDKWEDGGDENAMGE